MTELTYSREFGVQPALLDELKAIFRATALGIFVAALRTRS